ncbi:triphosphoribosyl-dephospho-CoA synthase [Phyllobacterium bourgognense]|uniref:Triphosphoribosyl-dephospho-CoA synthase n=1 Tax=Phyllobacterium bourgognense TaxID=314236 RepID=A0A368YKF1_9HYPH|nr:triphosphoribosyl-dephospho-CoA synthase [Phyllobacterium bourgognense]RCW79796.1 triphosphoribosyl-dephospho-CoA synthase [Phyllobacterium bourgognense]
MTPTREQIRRAYIDACYQEIDALKPGNVHRFADGHRMSAEQFFESAQASSQAVTDPALSTGQRILAAVRETRRKVGTNTNLGILLLCVPLAKAAANGGEDLQGGLATILEKLDIDDARDVFSAIMLAQPGGLGSAPKHDVSTVPQVSLLEAMGEAADRDMIARQYVSGFADIFDGGLTAYRAASDRGERAMWPVVFTYLFFLSAFPDSHIVRKHGGAIAGKTQKQAQQILTRVEGLDDGKEREKSLLAFDAQLKADNINPGTSADLTVATLFTFYLNLALHNDEVNA